MKFVRASWPKVPFRELFAAMCSIQKISGTME